VRGYVSCAVACPYEGPVEPAAVRGIAQRMLSAGVQEVALADTIGVAGPGDIERLYEGLQGLLAPQDTSLHLHDTRGTALACALRAIQLGVRRFDASCGGIGGCPYAPGAAGNLATEDLVYMCGRMGLETGVDLEALFAAARHAQQCLGRRLPGRVFTADGGPCSPDPA
jgi:hydroxymethylglutaryl-CoA lyase